MKNLKSVNLEKFPKIGLSFKYGATWGDDNVSKLAPLLFRGNLYESLNKAKKIGFEAMEIHLRQANSIDYIRLNDYCRQNNISICAIATGMGFVIDKLSLIDDDKKVRQEAVKRLKEHIELAEKLKSAVIIGSMRGNISDYDQYKKYEQYLIESIKELLDYAKEREVVLFLETINRYEINYLNSIEEIINFVDKIQSPFLRVHIDTFHMNIEDVDMIKSIKLCKNKLGYVHASDSNRKYPGAGHIDFKKILYTLKDIKYKGYITLECIPYPESVVASEEGLKFLKGII